MNLSWILVALSLFGNVLVIKKNVIGQWLWAVSNIGWIAYNFSIHAYSQAFLFSVYFCLCVCGIYEWSKKPKEEHV
jgi:nicotinamide riboside transporter PnuC